MNGPYSLEFRPAAARILRELPRDAAKRIGAELEALRDDPRPHGVTALQANTDLLRIRVGDYRVVYRVDDHELVVVVVHLGHRRDVYRTL